VTPFQIGDDVVVVQEGLPGSKIDISPKQAKSGYFRITLMGGRARLWHFGRSEFRNGRFRTFFTIQMFNGAKAVEIAIGGV